jgi:hypothetical protein
MRERGTMKHMEWDVLEHSYVERSNDWKASVIIIAASFVALEIFLHNYLLALLTIIGTGTLVLIAGRKPNLMHVTLGEKGVLAGSVFYPYNTLDAFAVVTHGTHHKILLESRKTIMPLIIIPVPEEVDPEKVHAFLEAYLEDKDLQEPFLHLIMEYFGF